MVLKQKHYDLREEEMLKKKEQSKNTNHRSLSQSNRSQTLFKTPFLDEKHPLFTTFISQCKCLY